jgi:hypothetical protein
MGGLAAEMSQDNWLAQLIIINFYIPRLIASTRFHLSRCTALKYCTYMHFAPYELMDHHGHVHSTVKFYGLTQTHQIR